MIYNMIQCKGMLIVSPLWRLLVLLPNLDLNR
uniref:Uncharacterized protein n=1 Tax=Arundo donax TaxID=35708 RepID=A0A0A9F6I5_ARUDO